MMQNGLFPFECAQGPPFIIGCVKKITNNEGWPGSEFTAFDGQEVLGLRAMGLEAVTMSRPQRRGRSLIRELGCVNADPASRVCRSCGRERPVRSSRVRRIVHMPVDHCATRLLVRGAATSAMPVIVRERTTCMPAAGRTLLSRAAVDWALREMTINKVSMAGCARTLGCSWNALDWAVRAEGMRILDGSDRHVTRIGVDEHVWRHTPLGDRYVAVIVDLTGRRRGEPARLLDMIPGRSAGVFSKWLEERGEEFRRRITVVTMDAFAGFKKAAHRMLPQATEVIDPFHAVRLASDRVDQTRRLQQERTGRRSLKGDRLYDCRRALLGTADCRTEKQQERVDGLLADPANRPFLLAYEVYQRIIDCYQQHDRHQGRRMMRDLIDALSAAGATRSCPELRPLGRTLRRRRDDILTYFGSTTPRTGPPRPSTGSSRPCEESPWDSGTSPTAGSDHSSTPAGSETFSHTLKREEPFILWPIRPKIHRRLPDMGAHRATRKGRGLKIMGIVCCAFHCNGVLKLW